MSNKYLRRADKAEEDLEAKLEAACQAKVDTVSLFGVAVPKPKSLARGNNTTKTTTQGAKDQDGDFKPEDITEDMIFSSDIVVGGEPDYQDADNHQQADSSAGKEEPSLARAVSVEHKEDGGNERIHFFNVTDRNRQIAQQITQAMSDESFSSLNSLDFNRLADFSLEAASCFMYSLDSDRASDRAVI